MKTAPYEQCEGFWGISPGKTEATKPEFYLKPFTETQPLLDALEEKQKALDLASERWLELEISE